MNPNSPELKSWVDVPGGSDFPIQNLPFGIFKTRYLSPVAGVAIGDMVIDLVYLQENGFFEGLVLPQGVFNQDNLNGFLSLGRKKCGEVRQRLSELLRHDNPKLRDNKAAREIALISMNEVQMQMPVRVPNYTDFYSSEQHAFNVGSMFRDPKNALLPNWKHLPVGYHGRASSIVVSGTNIIRPNGQVKPGNDSPPVLAPTSKLDFELEVAFVSCGNTPLGKTVSVAEASDHIFGFVLFNDWSARDVQQWEYVPLGPFLAKNFGSTISPWIVTLDALEPFMTNGPKQDPQVLPYLSFEGKKNFDVNLEVSIGNTTICKSNFKYLYWNVFQQLAHQTVNGCNIQVGDLYASGTISGPEENSYGSMLELTWNGQKPLTLLDGTTRKFIEDGDTVTMKGYAERNNVRIGFGECKGTILPAV
ncbi:MAG TPA: fumarylacetoacetase [Cyclobacteriaceae bacterium]|nr:fumarylacetoacetase [Cyclobacteriaceae bacterium]